MRPPPPPPREPPDELPDEPPRIEPIVVELVLRVDEPDDWRKLLFELLLDELFWVRVVVLCEVLLPRLLLLLPPDV